MNSSIYNSHKSFDQKSTSAAVKAKLEHGPYKRSMTDPRTRSNSNSFIISVKLVLENLTIEKYRYDICDANSAFRNIVQVTRYIVMNSHNTIMGTCASNKIFLAHRVEEKKKFVELIGSIRQKLRSTYSVVLVSEGFETDVPPVILSYLINFTLVCRILEGGKWIHIGDNMETLVESKFMLFNENNSNMKNMNINEKIKKSSFFNCTGFNLKIENYSVKKTKIKNGSEIYSAHLYIRIFVYFFKMLPLTEKEAETNMHVYCLPRCALPGSLLSIMDAKFDKRFNYKKYWFDVHGYVLTQSAVQKVANVHLYVQQFNYPLGAILKESPIKLLKHIEKKNMYDILNLLHKCEFLNNIHFNSIIFFWPEKKNKKIKGECTNEQECESDGEEINFPLVDNWSSDSSISNEPFKEEVQNMYAYNFTENVKTQNKIDLSLKIDETQKMKDGEKSVFVKNSTQKIENNFMEPKKISTANTYSSYGNIISDLGEQSINLDFSNDITKTMKNITYKYGTQKNNDNINDFLKNTALAYKMNTVDKGNQRYKSDTDMGTNDKTLYKEMQKRNDNKQCKVAEETKESNEINKKNKETNAKIDSFLSAVTQKYKTSNCGTNKMTSGDKEKQTKHENKEYSPIDETDDFFEGIDSTVLFSKDFQKFLNNIDDENDISTVSDKLSTVDFYQREQKRPNFKITEKMKIAPIKGEKNAEDQDILETADSEINTEEPSWKVVQNSKELRDQNNATNKRKGSIISKKENSKKLKEDK